MPRKTRVESAAVSERILNAAERLFVERGVDKISLQHVANAANVTRSAVCWHFSNKLGLYCAVAERLTTPSEQALQMLDERESGDPLSALRTYIFGILQRIVSDPRASEILKVGYISGIFVADTNRKTGRYSVRVDNWTGQIRRRVILAREQGMLSERVDPDAISVAVWLMMDGMIRTWVCNRASFNLLRQGESLIDPYLAGLKCVFPTTELLATVPQQLTERVVAPFQPEVVKSPLRHPPVQTNMFWHRRYSHDDGNR